MKRYNGLINSDGTIYRIKAIYSPFFGSVEDIRYDYHGTDDIYFLHNDHRMDFSCFTEINEKPFEKDGVWILKCLLHFDFSLTTPIKEYFSCDSYLSVQLILDKLDEQDADIPELDWDWSVL